MALINTSLPSELLLSPFALLGIAFVAFEIYLLVTRRFTTAATGFSFALLAAIASIWSIQQSRSSTASIGYIFVPTLAALVGVLGVVSGAWIRSTQIIKRAIAWICVAAAVLFVGVAVSGGLSTRSRNSRRDDAYAAFSDSVAHDRTSIAKALATRRGSERSYLDSAIRANIHDRAYLIAALANDSISPSVLDTLASSSDMGITLEAARNPSTASSTLERVYRTKNYPEYFFQALASHPNTPPNVLRELHQKPGVITGLDIWLAGNPSTPRDVLKNIADSARDTRVIEQLTENPSTDCKILSTVANTMMKRLNKSADDATVARIAERVPIVCASARDSAATNAR